MSDLTPISVEKTILALTTDIDNSAEATKEGHSRFLEAERNFDLAYARAYMAHEGPAHERRYAATLATQQERIDRDAAEVAHKFVEKSSRNLEKKLDAYRTLGTFVKQAYANAGRGEW